MRRDSALYEKDFLSCAQYVPGGFFVYRADDSEEILFANDDFIKIFECSDFEDFMRHTGGSFKGVVHPEDIGRVERQILEQIEGPDEKNKRVEDALDYVQYRILTKNGRVRYIEDFGRRVRNCGGEDLYFVFAIDLRNKKRESELDSLTGLLSREHFQHEAGARMRKGFPGLAFVWFDIDNFKIYNKRFGYPQGSEVLRELGAVLSSVFPGDILSRFADDNFVALTVWQDLEEKLKTVQKKLRQVHGGAALKLRAGIYFPSEGDGVDVSCDRAQLACDSIRRNHSVSSCLYHEDLSHSLSHNQDIVDILDEAIDRGDIKVYYQPIVRVMTGKICETEALTRWIDPQRGFISPADFVSTLEQYRDVHKLDLCTVRQVCADYKRRRINGQPLLPVSINLSRLDFELCDIFQEVERLVVGNNVPKDMLKIEITESVHGEDTNVMNLGIEKFRQNGYEVWMDDFGSGYSSLNVLKDYNFDTIKFDMKFLSDFGKSEKSRFILNSNLSMAKQMGIHSLAEGVETEEQLAYLKRIGFEKAQGYLFGKPMPLDDIFALPIPREDYHDAPYYERLGQIELPNQDIMYREDSVIADVRAMALLELRGGRLSILAENDAYRKWLGAGDETGAADRIFNSGAAKDLRERLLAMALDLKKREVRQEGFYAFARGNGLYIQMTFIAANPWKDASAYLVAHNSLTRLHGRAHDGDSDMKNKNRGALREYLNKTVGPVVDLNFNDLNGGVL